MQPRLFLSYSRADLVQADQVAHALTADGCCVWIDRRELLVGDDFVRALQVHLSNCDGLVVLLTRQSAQSSWVQAEVQRALALKIPVIVVLRESDALFPDALERLLRDVQRTTWSGDRAPELGEQIHRARSRRRTRVMRRVLTWGGAALFIAAMASIAVWRMDMVQAAARRGEVLARIGSASAFWSRAEIDSVIAPASVDPMLPPMLQQLAVDATQSVDARHNAWQGLAALHEKRESEWRFFVPDVNWSDGRITEGLWVNSTYAKGTIKGLKVERSRIAGIAFGPGPRDAQPGMTLIGSQFVDNDAWFLRIDGTQLLDVEFRDTRFRGAQIDLSGHAGVRFVSTPAGPARITGSLTIIEDSWITQHSELADANEMDLAEPEQEILFEGVQFVRTRFEGRFKPQWFRNSHFQDCVFAADLDRAALEENGNTIETTIWTAPNESSG